MKKRMKLGGALLTALLTVLLLMPAALAAQTEYQDGDYTFTLDKATATITKYTGTDSVVTVPSHVVFNGKPYPVEHIGDQVFYQNENLVSLTLPDTVQSLGYYTVGSCPNLEFLDLPNNMSSIHVWACDRNPKLTTVLMPTCDTVLENWCFQDCPSLCNIDLTHVVETGYNVFENSAIPSVYMPKCTKLGGWTFQGNTAVTSAIFSDNLVEMEAGAFEDCTSLSSVQLGNRIEELGAAAFSRTALTSVTIPASVKSLCDTFEECSQLVTTNINAKVIMWGTFEKCTSLKTVKLGKTVERIREHAFQNTESLESITIPKNTVVEKDAFLNAPVLSTIYGYKNSSAHEYAVANSINFVALKDEVQVQSLTLKKKSYTVALGSGTFNLGARSSSGKVTYASSKKKVAKVTASGTVKPVAMGYTRITVTAPQTDTYKKAVKYVDVFVVPQKNKLTSVTGNAKKMTFRWKKDAKANGYFLEYAQRKNFSGRKRVTIKNKNTVTTSVKNLKKGTWFFRVGSYRTINGKPRLVWSNTVKRTIK